MISLFEGGVCVNDLSSTSVSCKCLPNFSGVMCQNPVIPGSLTTVSPNCRSLFCLNGGVCENADPNGGVYCRCPPNFTGFYCQSPVITSTSSPNCANLVCLNGSLIIWYKIFLI